MFRETLSFIGMKSIDSQCRAKIRRQLDLVVFERDAARV
jgi:hypothetical protein